MDGENNKRGFWGEVERFTAVVRVARASLKAAQDALDTALAVADETTKADDAHKALAAAREVNSALDAYNEASKELDRARKESELGCAPPDLKRARVAGPKPKDQTSDKAPEAAAAFLAASKAPAPDAPTDTCNFNLEWELRDEGKILQGEFIKGRQDKLPCRRTFDVYSPLPATHGLKVEIVGHQVAAAPTGSTAEEFYKTALGDICGKDVRVVICGGDTWDDCNTARGETVTVSIDLTPATVHAFVFLTTALANANVPGWWSPRATDYMTHEEGMLYYLLTDYMTHEEGMLYYLLLKANTVDILTLCSGIYRDKDVAKPLAIAFARLLRWAQSEAHRVMFTSSDWAANFLSKHFTEMTGVQLPFKVVKTNNSSRDVCFVGGAKKALTCPLTALRSCAACVKAGEVLELTIHEMDNATKVEIIADGDAACCKTDIYLATKKGDEMAIWTTTFSPSDGAGSCFTMLWSTTHLSEVRSVDNIDREQSAVLARATFPGEKGEITATQILDADDDSVKKEVAELVRSQASGSTKNQQASTAPQPTTHFYNETPACSQPGSPVYSPIRPTYSPTRPPNYQPPDTPGYSPTDQPMS